MSGSVEVALIKSLTSPIIEEKLPTMMRKTEAEVFSVWVDEVVAEVSSKVSTVVPDIEVSVLVDMVAEVMTYGVQA